MDQDKIRTTLFPHLTPEQFADMVARQRAEFDALPKEEQGRQRAKVEQMGEDIEAAKQRVAERIAKQAITTAQRKARGSKN